MKTEERFLFFCPSLFLFLFYLSVGGNSNQNNTTCTWHYFSGRVSALLCAWESGSSRITKICIDLLWNLFSKERCILDLSLVFLLSFFIYNKMKKQKKLRNCGTLSIQLFPGQKRIMTDVIIYEIKMTRSICPVPPTPTPTLHRKKWPQFVVKYIHPLGIILSSNEFYDKA